MKKKPAIFMTIEDEDGNIIKEIPMTEADSDWIRAGRLAKKAWEGDKEAAEKLRQMENTQMVEIVEDEDNKSGKMRIELPDINEMIELLLPIKSSFSKETKTIEEWMLEHRGYIQSNKKLIALNDQKARFTILRILLSDLLMRAMKGEQGAKIRISLEKHLNNDSDLNKKNYKSILEDCQYRFTKNGLHVIKEVVHYFKNKLKWDFSNYFTKAEKNYIDNFTSDPLLKIKYISYKVRDLALSNFNEHYIANDLHIVRVSTRIGLLNYGFEFLPDPMLEMGNNPQNTKNYLFLHKLFIKLSDQTNGQYSPVDMDRIFWHFGRTVCGSGPKCANCPINILCLTGRNSI